MENELTLTEQTDKDFESALDNVKDESQTPPATPPDEGTGKTQPEPLKPPEPAPENKPATEPVKTSAEVKDAPSDKPEKPIYAGKYFDKYNLMNGTMEANKAAGHDNKELVELFKKAEESNDWSPVESKYKELSSAVTKKIEEDKKAEEEKKKVTPSEPPVKEPEATVKPDSPEFDTYVNQVFEQQKDLLAQETRRRFDQTDVAAAMSQAKIDVPQTDEELTVLMRDNYGLWKDFTSTVKNIAKAVREDAKTTLRLRQEAPIHNKTQVEKTKKQIEDFGKEWNKTFTPEEIDAILKEAEKDGNIYENKSGVQMIRDGAYSDYFHARKAMGIIRAAVEEQKKAIAAENRNQGAVAAQEAFDKNKTEQIPSASALHSPAASDKVKKFDVGASGLTAEDFDKEANKLLESD